MKLPVEKFNIVIDCPDAAVLAEFYCKLLGWEWTHPAVDGWAEIESPTGTVLLFQEIEGYEPPVWPWLGETQGQMLHIDFCVNNLNDAVKHALQHGAKLADAQYYNNVRTLIDPAGHPFCLYTPES